MSVVLSKGKAETGIQVDGYGRSIFKPIGQTHQPSGDMEFDQGIRQKGQYQKEY